MAKTAVGNSFLVFDVATGCYLFTRTIMLLGNILILSVRYSPELDRVVAVCNDCKIRMFKIYFN